MSEQETMEPEYEELNEEHEIKIDDNKLKIAINNDEISFVLSIGLSYYKYIKQYKYKTIKEELNILEYKNIKEIYNYLIKRKYQIIKEQKKIIIDGDKEIKLDEKKFTDENMINILIEEVIELKKKMIYNNKYFIRKQ